MTLPTTNGHGPQAGGNIVRTPSFTPVTPGVKEKVGDVATRLLELEGMVDAINLQSAASSVRSPTMGDLQQEIDLLKKDVEEAQATQKKQIDGIKGSIKDNVKEHITRTTRAEVENKIQESVEEQVRISMEEWGGSTETKKLVQGLKVVVENNEELIREAQIKLENSRSRHHNSTLDEHEDFETNLSKIKLPDGNVSEGFPRTLKMLFSYDDTHLHRLLDEYGLQRLDTHLENLNRFLSFIGLRFSIPEQSLIFLDQPPAYSSPNATLESSKEENPTNAPPLPDPAPAAKSDPIQQEKQPNEKPTESENHNVQRNHVGIELSEFGRQQPITQTMEPRPRLSSLTHPSKSAHPNHLAHQNHPNRPTHPNHPGTHTNHPTHPNNPTHPNHPTHPSPSSSTSSNPSGVKGVGGWFKSFVE